MIPRTRELLMHVRQLSQLAVDDPDARARARRCKRLLKVRAHPNLYPSILISFTSLPHFASALHIL